MKYFTIIIFILYLIPNYGQETNKAGTTAAQFLKIGAGSASLGMAGVSAGLVNDASSMYWNPAGLIGVNSISVIASYTDWFVDLKHQYFGIVLPINEDHKVGLSAMILTMGEMEITTEQQPKGTGDFFDASDVMVGLTYSARLVDFFNLGITIKYITQNMYNETASALAVDIGTTLNTGYNGIKIGMALTNFGTTMTLAGRDLQKSYDPLPNDATNVGIASNLKTEAWELPLNFRVGIGWDLMGKGDVMVFDQTHNIKIGIDANHPNDGPENASVGFEYKWQNLISLRSGYYFNDDVRKLTLGFGLNWEVPQSFDIGIDYAYAELDRLGAVHSISVKVGF
jgi:hypothetical protein